MSEYNPKTGDLGWAYEREDRPWLNATSTPVVKNKELLTSLAKDVKKRNIRKWLQVENQGGVGSCQGHALSTVCEIAYWFATGKIVQFNRAFAYRATQIIDGINGDRGSTIAGGCKLAMTKGMPLESSYPYRADYNYISNFPKNLYEEATAHLIKSHTVLRGYQEMYEYLLGNTGAIELGVGWGGSYFKNGVFYKYTGGGGGHAIAFVDIAEEKDSQGRHYLIGANSHTNDVAPEGQEEPITKGGIFLVDPVVCDQLRNDGNAIAIGMSDMETPEPRVPVFAEEARFT